MEIIRVVKKGIGVNFSGNGEASVRVWAPEKQDVKILVNDSLLLTLNKEPHGYWHIATSDIHPGDRYSFVLDNGDPLPDPASLSQPAGPHEASEAVDLSAYQWTDAAWNNLPLKDYIFYELHTGTFSEEGTFEGIEKKLDHLLELGITAIEIMPVAQFPGGRNWGYDGVFPFAVQNTYGGAERLQHLVNICHQKGLAVVLDVVYNHLGPEGNYFESYGPYFTDKYHTPWGKAVNFDDAWCDGVRRYFIENVLMWFRDFHIDALRMDAVHAIKDFSPAHILKDIRLHTDRLVERTGRTHYLIVECDLNDTRFIDPVDKGGYNMDAQWMDEFHHSLRVTAGQERHGYYADFSGLAHLAKSYRDAYVYDGIYSEHRKKTFGNNADKNAGQQFVVFSQNHDQVGNRMLGERTGTLVSFEMQKLIAASVMVSPFLPLLFMGEEYGETNPFLYFVSHTDPELQEAVRKGRKAEFKDFHSLGEAPDPQSEETFNRSKLQWRLLQQPKHATMLAYYKALIKLRRTNAVLASAERVGLEVSANEERQTLILKRANGSMSIICFMNFSKQPQSIRSANAQQWSKLWDSAAPEWNGPQAAPAMLEPGGELKLQPESILIYSN